MPLEAGDHGPGLADRVRQVLDPHVIELGEGHRSLDAVLQLSHVARPGVREERVRGAPGEAEHPALARLGAAQHVVGDRQDVAAAQAKRRDLDVDDVDPVEEVLAEPLLRDLVLEVPVGGRQDPRVERDLGVSADRPDRALLEGAQELGLHSRRHLPDLVQEEGSSGGLQEEPSSRLAGVGEGALHVTKQLALEADVRASPRS